LSGVKGTLGTLDRRKVPLTGAGEVACGMSIWAGADP
jgi:hypothetical protein